MRFQVVPFSWWQVWSSWLQTHYWLQHLFWFCFAQKRSISRASWQLCDANHIRGVGTPGRWPSKACSQPELNQWWGCTKGLSYACAQWHRCRLTHRPRRRAQSANLDAWAACAVPGECLASWKALVTRDSKGPECSGWSTGNADVRGT